MALSPEFFLILDALTVLLCGVLAYLIYKKLAAPIVTEPARSRKVPAALRAAAEVLSASDSVSDPFAGGEFTRAQAVSALLDQRLNLRSLLADAKRKFLEGAITEHDFKLLSKTHHGRIKEVEDSLRGLGVGLPKK
ncbi:hypothetical protein HY095_05320 [Candidatus Micrarchaeota archaeon]|nr:hypothetical protein [Candidatus Micrarchaeota archaeon]